MIFDEICEAAKNEGYDRFGDSYLINAGVFKIDDVLDVDKEDKKIAAEVDNYFTRSDWTPGEHQAPDNEFKYYYNNPPYPNCAFCWKHMVYWIVWRKDEKGDGCFSLFPFTNMPLILFDQNGTAADHSVLFPAGIERIDFYEIGSKVFLSETFLKSFNGDARPYPIELTKLKISFVNTALMFINLLNCSNIESVKNDPPPKLNKARLRRGKLPLCSFKTLVINSDKFIRRSQKGKPPIYSNRIHLCRGHFKQFRPDRPLFGKYSGLYWWQPCVRGNNKDGVVIKRYEYEDARAGQGECPGTACNSGRDAMPLDIFEGVQ